MRVVSQKALSCVWKTSVPCLISGAFFLDLTCISRYTTNYGIKSRKTQKLSRQI